VFSGEVVRLGVEDPEPRDDVSLGRVSSSVEKSWKSVSKRSVVIHGQGERYGTWGVSNSCHIEFERGKTYLVYAYRAGGNGDHLSTGICSGTKPLADEGLRALGPPTVRLSGPGSSTDSSSVSATGIVSVALIVLVSALVARRLRHDERT
jgi:hypothetical protein